MIRKLVNFLFGQYLIFQWKIVSVARLVHRGGAAQAICIDGEILRTFLEGKIKRKFGWRSQKTEAVLSVIWSDIASESWDNLLYSLETGEDLEQIYADFLNSSLILGIEDDISTGKGIKLRDYYYSFRFIGQIFKYAQEVGLVEKLFFHQPAVGRLRADLNALLLNFGERFDLNSFVTFRGYALADERIPTDLADAAYFTDFIDAILAIQSQPCDSLKFCELGGGSGLLATEFLSRNKQATFVFSDLVPFLMWQFTLFRDRCDYLPAECVDSWYGPLDVLINQDSFPEIPSTVLSAYVEKFRGLGVRHVFSYNQRSLIRDQTDHVGILVGAGFDLVYSTSSRVREGYYLEYFRRSNDVQGAG